SKESKSGEMLLLRLRYKEPESDTSELLEFPVKDEQKNLGQASKDFRFATAVAGFGMLLRDSKFKGDLSYDAVLEIGEEAAKDDAHGYRKEFLELVRAAKRISGQ
ncbi:MAG: Ca-activated chloride channel family protein, partial [Pirellulaceae bacterium]